MKYVIRWGEEWRFQLIPLHKAEPIEGEKVYCSKEAALDGAVNVMFRTQEQIRDAIDRAYKKRRLMDRRRMTRTDAVLSRYA